MVQVPTETSVTVEPATVQTGAVSELKLTGRPDVAVALSANGAVPNARSESAPKVILWLACVTWKLWFTGVAAGYVESPACVAWIVQVPPATRGTVEPDTVQTGAVSELKLTGRPDVAVTLAANGAAPMGCAQSAAKLMVWLP